MSCPSYSRIFELLDLPGANPGSSDSVLGSHLDRGCGTCHKRTKLAKNLLAELAAGPLSAVPDRIHERCLKAVMSAHEELQGLQQRSLKAIEQSGMPELLTLRGNAMCGELHQFRVGPHQVDLAMIEPSTLVGTLYTDEDANSDRPEGGLQMPSMPVFCVLCGEDGVRQTRLERNGDFRFESVQAGNYLLVLEAPGWDVVIEDLVLGTESTDS